MSKKTPPKGKAKHTETTLGLILKRSRTAAKKAARHTTRDKSTACFDGAGNLDPSKTKTDPTKKR